MPASVSDELVEQRILEQAARCGDRAVITGWAALRLHGGGHFDGLDRDGKARLPVPIAANGERLADHPGIHRVRDTVPPDEMVVIHGIRCATVERALFDEMRRIRAPRERTVAADMTFAAQLTSLLRMRRYVASRRWFRDVRTVDASFDMADEGSRSGPEGFFRMIWEHDAGWGRPLCNRAILDLDGRLLGVPDLLDVKRRVVGEYAGADHRDIDRHESDIAREALFRGVGLEYVEVVGRDLGHPPRVVRRMEEAEARAGLLPQLWQLGPEAPSLDEILDRRDRTDPVE